MRLQIIAFITALSSYASAYHGPLTATQLEAALMAIDGDWSDASTKILDMINNRNYTNAAYHVRMLLS